MNRIKELRKSHNLTLDQLGKIINASESAVSLYENEKRQPALDMLIKIADCFHVSLDYLLGRTDNPATAPMPSVTSALSEDELQLISYYRKLNASGKEHILWSAKIAAESHSAQEARIQQKAT